MSFSAKLVEVVQEYFPGNAAPAGLLPKVEDVYESSSAIGAFEMDVSLPKHSNKQVDVLFNDQDFEYEITYTKDSVTKTQTFFATIASLEYETVEDMKEAIERAFQDAVLLDKNNQKKNIGSVLGFNALWKIVGSDLKLLIPSSVSNFSITSLKYKTVPYSTNDVINLADDASLIDAVKATWDGTLASIPAGGFVLPLNTLSYPYEVKNNGKVLFKDASGAHFFGVIENGNYSTGELLATKMTTALTQAYYRDETDAKVTHGAITVTFDGETKKFTFADTNTPVASAFLAVNGSAYEIYKMIDETGFLSGLKVSQVALDNRTGNFGGSVVIDSTHKKLKYEVKYIDSAKAEQILTSTVTLTEQTYNLSQLATELQTQLNAPLNGQDLGSWAVTVNQIKDGAGNLVDTNNLKVVYDAAGAVGVAGKIDGGDKRSIVSVKFVPVADDAYAETKIIGKIYENVKIANNIVFNDTDVIKALPDAGLTVSGTVQYQIIYTDASGANNEIKSVAISGTHQTAEDLATHVQTQLQTLDGRWSVSWSQANEKFVVQYDPTAVSTRTSVQVKFTNNAASQLLGISQVEYKAASSASMTIDTVKFIQNFVTIPANAKIDVEVDTVFDQSVNIVSKSYLSGDALASAIDGGDLAVYWKDNKLRIAFNKVSTHDDVVVLKPNTVALRELLKLGGNFFIAGGIKDNSTQEVSLWNATGVDHNVKIKIPNIVDLFPDSSMNIIQRFFPDASDNILDIYKLTDGLKNVLLDNAQSYIKAVGLTAGAHVENDWADAQDDLRIQVFLGGATAGSEMYTVTVEDDESVTRTYDVFVTGTEFSYINDANEQALIENMIRKTYDEELYERIRDNIEVKVKELISYILHEWVVAVNNDPQQSDYLTNNVLGDLQAKIVDKIADDSGVFSLLKPEEYATMIQAFQAVLPVAKGSSYIALRKLEDNDYLADPHELFKALKKDDINTNIYKIINVPEPAGVEEFLREYYDRILRAYAELVRRYLLAPKEDMTVFKPANIALALAYAMDIHRIGNMGTSNSGNDDGEYYIGLADVSEEENAQKMSNLINAITHNIYDDDSTRKTSSQIISGVLAEAKTQITNSIVALFRVQTLINTTKNNEQTPAMTKGLGQQSEEHAGLGYLTTILLSHHLLHKILVEGDYSLFKSADKLTEARWNRLMLAYEQEGRCIPVDFLKEVDYIDVSGVLSGSQAVRLARIGRGLFEAFSEIEGENLYSEPSHFALKNIGNLHTYMQRFMYQVDYINSGFVDGVEYDVVAVSGAVEVTTDNVHHGEYIIKGVHADKTEGLLRYYIDTLYDFIVLEGASSPHTFAVIPFHQQIKGSLEVDMAKGMAHSIFYRHALDNKFSDILKILGTHYGNEGYFNALTAATSISSLPVADVSLDISGDSMTKEQLQEVVVQKGEDLMQVLNDKMRERIFGTVLREDPGTGRVSLTATPELQAQVNLMKFYDSYIKRFAVVDQGLILGLLIQQDKRIEQQERTADSSAKLSSGEYLAEIHRYLDEIVAKKHLFETQFASLADPFLESSTTRSVSSRSIILPEETVKARDVIVLGQVMEIARSAAVDLWKNDIIAAITIEELRYNAAPGANNDLSELLNIYEKAVQQIEESIIAVANNQSVVDRTLDLLTVGLSGTPEERIAAIQEASRESDALQSAKSMMDCIVVVVSILNTKLEQLISVQQNLDAKVKNYNRLHSVLVKATADLQNVLGAIPPQFANFTEMAQALAESLKGTLELRDTVVGKVASLRSALNIMQTATLKYKDATVPKVELTADFTLVSSNVKIMP